MTSRTLKQSLRLSTRFGWQDIGAAVRRVPQRLQDRRFWYVQLLMLAATLGHYAAELTGYSSETIHGLAVSLYLLPLLYAALNFSWEGAVLTAVWGIVLTSPSIWIWHHDGFHWFGEVAQLVVLTLVGLVVASKVELETKQRLRAEKTTAELGLLNEIGAMLIYTFEIEHELSQVLCRLVAGLPARSAWLCLTPEVEGGSPLLLQQPAAPPAKETILDFDRQLQKRHTSTVVDGDLVAVRLLGEHRMLGSLGAAAAAPGGFNAEQVRLLSTVAVQVGVVVENVRLYRQRQENLQSYVRQVSHAQEEERRRIARDLHDATAQELARMTRKLDQLRHDIQPALAPAVDELLGMTRDTLNSVRRFSRDLRPSVLDDLGLVPAIETMVEDANQRLALDARVAIVGSPRRLDAAVEIALFRIVQEALRNVEKHAAATAVAVAFAFEESGVRLSVADDGAGFDCSLATADLPRRGKLGLLGMRERAELIGGSFEVQSSPGLGTCVTVEVPQSKLEARV